MAIWNERAVHDWDNEFEEIYEFKAEIEVDLVKAFEKNVPIRETWLIREHEIEEGEEDG